MKWLLIFLGTAALVPRAFAQDFQPHSSSGWIPYHHGTNAPSAVDPNGGVKIESVRPGPPDGDDDSTPVPMTNLRTPQYRNQAPLQIPVLTDPNNYSSENNWLASIIARRLVDFARLINGPSAGPAADLKIDAQVDAKAGKVHLEISGFANAPVKADLQPEFAWDAHGYAPLAGRLLDGWHSAGEPSADLPDELTLLQDLSAENLVRGDLAVSALLQKYPAWSEAHEQAALLLVALALRDHAGQNTDTRRMLGRATAHLALAEALRGGAVSPTWAGKIADAGIRALAGREVDALAKLDALEAATDCAPAAKVWIAALRLRAKDDWRVVTPDKAPLLLKIAWFDALADNLPDLTAIKQFRAVVGDFPPVTDWGHAVLATTVQTSVEGQNRFCLSTLGMEIVELAQVLNAEGTPLKKDSPIGPQLAEPLVEQLFSGPNGELRVIGPEMFKDFARQHLVLELRETYWWYKKLLGLEADAEAFRKTAWANFCGMRLGELTGLYEPGADESNVGSHLELEEAVLNDNVKWHPWEIAAGESDNGFLVKADQDELESFYRDGLPFGTAYNVGLRPWTLAWGSGGHPEARVKRPDTDDPHDYMGLFEYMRTAPWPKAHPVGNIEPFILEAGRDPNAIHDCYPPAKDLLALAPSSYVLFDCGKDIGDLITGSRPWWDYNLISIRRLEYFSFLLDDATYEELLRKNAALDATAYFTLGHELREQGRDDEAAVADRKGFDESPDRVGASNSVGPLIDYYYDHGRKADALMVAKAAADVGSEGGMLLYSNLLEKMGRLTDADHVAQDIFSRYQNHSRLDELFAAHPDVFTDQNIARAQELFPQGLKKVAYSDFKEAPQSGCQIRSDSALLEEGGLENYDVIVALDSYRVEGSAQYNYIRAMKRGDNLDLIIWRDSHYYIAHTSAPHRLFGVTVQDYVPRSSDDDSFMPGANPNRPPKQAPKPAPGPTL